MTAKAVGGAHTPPENAAQTEPKDLSHIRVGPPFLGRTGGRCVACRGQTKGMMIHIVENTRTDSRKAICADCLLKNEALAARQSEDGLGSFLE